jgi:hypothetical protein
VESFLLYISYFFSDDDLLEVYHGVLYFNILILKHIFCLFLVIVVFAEGVYSPSHVRVFVDHLL